MAHDDCIVLGGHSARLWASGQDSGIAISELLRCGVSWDRWGTCEPYEWAFSDAAAGRFHEVWREQFSQIGFGSVAVQVEPTEMLAMFHGFCGPRPHPSRFAVRCPEEEWKPHAAGLLGLTHSLFVGLQCFHGDVHHDEEFDNQHRVDMNDVEAILQHGAIIGVGYKESLPGVYWGNLFGPPVTQWIGEDRLRTCPCHEHRELAPGYHLIIAYPDVFAHDTPEAMSAKDAIREHLGVERFFDRRFPHRQTTPPPLDWSELYRPPPTIDPAEAAAELEKLKEKARQMGGWLETRKGQIRLHLEGTSGPEANGEGPESSSD